MGCTGLQGRANVKRKHIVGLLAHPQIGHHQVVLVELHFEKPVGEPCQALQLRVFRVLCGQRPTPLVGHKTNGPAAVHQGVKAFVKALAVERHHAPQQGAQWRGRDQELLAGQALSLQGLTGVLRHTPLRQCAPRQIHGAERQCPAVDGQGPAHRFDAQGGHHTRQQGQRIHRVNDEHAAQAIRLIGEWLEHLRAVNRHQVQQGVRDQRQHQRPPPTGIQLRLAVDAAHRPSHRESKEGEQEQSVRLGAVPDHVQDRIAMVQQHIQVGQQASHTAPKSRLPQRGAPPHDGHANRGAQKYLCDGIHGAFCAE